MQRFRFTLTLISTDPLTFTSLCSLERLQSISYLSVIPSLSALPAWSAVTSSSAATVCACASSDANDMPRYVIPSSRFDVSTVASPVYDSVSIFIYSKTSSRLVSSPMIVAVVPSSVIDATLIIRTCPAAYSSAVVSPGCNACISALAFSIT